MTTRSNRRWGWLLPVALALPFVGCAIWFVAAYGQLVMDLIGVALKVTVIR